MRSAIRPRSVSKSMSQVCGPVWRQSRSIVIPCEKASRAAMGVWQFAGMSRSAPVRCTGAGRISVRMESALMPGSNTPMPPGSNTQCWPGCHLRTSSRQVTWPPRMTAEASRALAAATPCAIRLCQVA